MWDIAQVLDHKHATHCWLSEATRGEADLDKQHWPPMTLYFIMLVTSSTLYRLHYITSVPVRWSEARPVEPS